MWCRPHPLSSGRWRPALLRPSVAGVAATRPTKLAPKQGGVGKVGARGRVCWGSCPPSPRRATGVRRLGVPPPPPPPLAPPHRTQTASAAKRRAKSTVSAALGDLSTLSASLTEAGEAKQQRQFGESVGTSRARAKVAEVESGRLAAVLAHPTFQADPLAAVTSHLAATLPQPPAATGGPRRKLSENEAKARRREKKRRQRGRGAMAAD